MHEPSCCGVQVLVQRDRFPITYKYALLSSAGQLELEAGENRLISLPTQGSSAHLMVLEDGHFRFVMHCLLPARCIRVSTAHAFNDASSDTSCISPALRRCGVTLASAGIARDSGGVRESQSQSLPCVADAVSVVASFTTSSCLWTSVMHQVWCLSCCCWQPPCRESSLEFQHG